MEHKFFGNPKRVHNNDESPITTEKKRSGLPHDNQRAIDATLKASAEFENLMARYSIKDKETWDKCIIAGAKLVLFFEFNQSPRTSAQKVIFADKLKATSVNSIEKIIQLATEKNLTLDSTISVERAAIAYFEKEKNISPKSQPSVQLRKQFYINPKKNYKAAGA